MIEAIAHGTHRKSVPYPLPWEGYLPEGGQGHLGHIVSILGASAASDLLWEEAIRVVSDEVIVSALDGSRGEPLHVGYPLYERLGRGDVDFVVAIGAAEEVERLAGVVNAQGCAFVALSAER